MKCTCIKSEADIFTGGYLNIGRGHWRICRKHKKKWFIGSNLFSSWRQETKEKWISNFTKIKNYENIEVQKNEK